MHLYSPRIRLIELTAILISLVCHFAFAGLITLKLPSHNSTFKPSLIFLGSLLGDDDFRNLTAKRGPSLEGGALSTVKTKTYPNPFGTMQEVSKPEFSAEKPPQEKTFIKSTFMKAADQTTAMDENIKNLGVDLSIPKREPLKLDSK